MPAPDPTDSLSVLAHYTHRLGRAPVNVPSQSRLAGLTDDDEVDD